MNIDALKYEIEEAVKTSESLDDIRCFLFDVFRELKNQGHEKIGYVAGIITSEGPENIAKNLKRLEKFTQNIRSQSDFPIFSATDIFNDELSAKLNANGYINTDYEVFFRQVLTGEESRFVTDIFMTPRWEVSHGARDEHETAKNIGIEIHYLNEEI